MPAPMDMTLEELARFLDRHAEQLLKLDLSDEMRVCAQLAKSDFLNNFAGSHAPDGTAWAPLKRPRQGKRHRNSSPLPLRDTGLLMASVTMSGPYHVERVTDTSMEVGTNLSYSAIHQFGGTVHHEERRRVKPWVFTNEQGQTIFTRRIKAHDVTIPARPFLGWSPALIEQVSEVLGEALERGIGGGP